MTTPTKHTVRTVLHHPDGRIFHVELGDYALEYLEDAHSAKHILEFCEGEDSPFDDNDVKIVKVEKA